MGLLDRRPGRDLRRPFTLEDPRHRGWSSVGAGRIGAVDSLVAETAGRGRGGKPPGNDGGGRRPARAGRPGQGEGRALACPDDRSRERRRGSGSSRAHTRRADARRRAGRRAQPASASRSWRSSRRVNIATPSPSARSRPLLARPVAVELDAVPVRVAQVDRLADAVVGGAVERDAGVEHAAHGVGQRPPVRDSGSRRERARSCPAAAVTRPCDSQVFRPMWWW